MTPPTLLANYSRDVYEYTMIKRFEKRMEAERKRQRIRVALISTGFVISAVILVALAVWSESFIRMILL